MLDRIKSLFRVQPLIQLPPFPKNGNSEQVLDWAATVAGMWVVLKAHGEETSQQIRRAYQDKWSKKGRG